MDTTAAKLTVFFEEPFWVGVYERTESGQVEACRVVFGAEPKDYEVYDFLLKHWDSMRFSPPVAAEGIPSQIRNPKRRGAQQSRRFATPEREPNRNRPCKCSGNWANKSAKKSANSNPKRKKRGGLPCANSAKRKSTGAGNICPTSFSAVF